MGIVWCWLDIIFGTSLLVFLWVGVRGILLTLGSLCLSLRRILVLG